MTVAHYSVLASLALLTVACDNAGRVVDPSTHTMSAAGSLPLMSAGPNARRVSVMDACDGPTFNAVIGPGTCARNGGVPFLEFVAQLTAHQTAGAWHNAPPQTDAWVGETLVAHNDGGEVHTFTRVAQFGGGVVPFLNALAGTPNVAQECLGLPPAEFMAPGGTDSEVLDQAGDIKFECCIHPWMRTTVHVRSK